MAGFGLPKHAVDESELVNSLKSALRNAEVSVWREQRLKNEIEKKRRENDLLQAKFETEVSERLKVEKEFGDLKESASRLRDERDGLCKRLKEKEDDLNEIIDLKRKICELECDKLKAKNEADVYQMRIKELEGKVLIINVEKDVTIAETNSGKKLREDFVEENSNPIVGLLQMKRTGLNNELDEVPVEEDESEVLVSNVNDDDDDDDEDDEEGSEDEDDEEGSEDEDDYE